MEVTALASFPKPNWYRRIVLYLAVAAIVLPLLLHLALTALRQGISGAVNSSFQQQNGRMIGQLLFSYATDNTQNKNAYPDGNSSTEVFQKLLDKHYVDSPNLFYFPMPGKIEPQPGQRLRPENVCWDYTAGIDATSQTTVPLLFITGYKVNYVPGGAAIPLVPHAVRLIASFYFGNNVRTIFASSSQSPDGTIHNFVPADFKSDGHVYRQLTPDGILP